MESNRLVHRPTQSWHADAMSPLSPRGRGAGLRRAQSSRGEAAARRYARIPHGYLASLLVGVACLSRPLPAQAQTTDSAIPPAVASTLDDETVAVLSVDTTRLDLESGLRQVLAIPVLSERQRGDLQAHKESFALWLDQFHKAGGREIWFVLTLADDLADGPFAVVPLADGANRQALEGLFVAGKHSGPPNMDYPFSMQAMVERDGGLVFVAERSLKRLSVFTGRLAPFPSWRSMPSPRTRSAGSYCPPTISAASCENSSAIRRPSGRFSQRCRRGRFPPSSSATRARSRAWGWAKGCSGWLPGLTTQ